LGFGLSYLPFCNVFRRAKRHQRCDFIRGAFLGEPEQTTLNNPTVESVAGIYSCNKKTGCKDKYVIMLREDQTIELLSSVNPSVTDELKNEDPNSQEVEVIDDVTIPEDKKPVERSSIVFLDASGQPLGQPATEQASSTTIVVEDATSSLTTTTTTPETTSQETPQQENGEEGIPSSITSLTELEDATKAVVEKGTWSFGGGNILIITLTSLGDTEYNTPQKLVIKKIGSSTLSSISFNKQRYKEMIKPVFVKVEN
jgi:hypothetical protein